MARTYKCSIPERHRRRVSYVLFMSRLYQEGRIVEYLDEKNEGRLKGVSGPTHEGRLAGRIRGVELRKKYGFTKPSEEYQRFQANLHKPAYNRRKEMQAQAMKSRGRAAIGKALADLPPVASVEQEMAWVRSHPKMTDALTRKLTQGPDEEYKPPRLGIADLSDVTPACPSRGAWNTLLAALSDPKKFNDVLLTKQKDAAMKAADTTDSDVDEIDDLGLDEVERMLKAAVERSIG